ncbi:MAG: hypothetical protein ACLSWP_11030 [Terrisporobacter sp.]|uniref:hypothetical protein n=1 Tax=Terrisporobacter sp. TaxID=1965305 RepID=UPI003991205A
MSTRVHYSPEIKWKAIDMKLNGSTTKEIMNKLGIKNKSQIMTWLIWYKMVIEIVSSLQIIIFYKFFFLGQNKINHIQRM